MKKLQYSKTEIVKVLKRVEPGGLLKSVCRDCTGEKIIINTTVPLKSP